MDDNVMPLIELLGDGTVLMFKRRWWQPGNYLYCDTKGAFILVPNTTSGVAYSLSHDDVLANDWMEYEPPPTSTKKG